MKDYGYRVYYDPRADVRRFARGCALALFFSALLWIGFGLCVYAAAVWAGLL